VPERNNADSMQRNEKAVGEAAQPPREQPSDAHTVTHREDSCTVPGGSAVTIPREDALIQQGFGDENNAGGDADEGVGKRDPRDFALWKAAKVCLCMYVCMWGERSSCFDPEVKIVYMYTCIVYMHACTPRSDILIHA
jgi:hypothetical protein